MAGPTASATHCKTKGRTARPGHNTLLVKHEVGKTRTTVYDLPSDDHVYGKRVERDPLENTALVVQHWNVNATTQQAIPALDYITMNRNSAKQGIISPKSIRDFRETYPVRIKVGNHALYGDKSGSQGSISQRARGPLPSDTNHAFTYGKPTRSSTPVARLMTDQYQREWLKQLNDKQEEQESLQKAKAIKKMSAKKYVPREPVVAKPKLMVEKDTKTLFKLSKFKNVPSKIVSHRSENDPAMAGILGVDRVSATADGMGTHKGKQESRATGVDCIDTNVKCSSHEDLATAGEFKREATTAKPCSNDQSDPIDATVKSHREKGVIAA
ncbi:hypothetical protein BSLG_004706 [Batrachochytrium salamandrivorans]|nr:hypothetical protein BSLG_004706 [Batrachochytrium salamandrivorans]